MSDLLPPPSTGVPAVQNNDRPPKTMDFTPVWRQWFIDLVNVLNQSGGNEGAESVIGAKRIDTVKPLQGGGKLTGNLTLTIDTFTVNNRGVVPASGGGITNFLRADGTWAPPAAGTSGFSGSVPLAKLTVSGANGSMTFVNGLLTSVVPPT